MNNSLTGFISTFTNVSKKPYEFLSIQTETAERVKDFIKQLYDYTKYNEENNHKNTLPKLIVQHFDEEQIWQELELQNGSCTNDIIQTVSQLSAKKNKLTFPLKLKSNINKTEEKKVNKLKNQEIVQFEGLDNNYDNEDECEENEEASDSNDENFPETENENILKKAKLKPSVVDDKFFKLSELELFLKNEERNQDKPGKENETFDLFNNIDKEAADYKYSDFFENPDGPCEIQESNDITESGDGLDDDFEDDENYNEDGDSFKNIGRIIGKRKHDKNDGDTDTENKENDYDTKNNKKVRFSLLNSDEEEKSEEDSDAKLQLVTSKKGGKTDKAKSTFEQRQERLGNFIGKLQEEALSEKPWQLSGEVTASSRPQNSLLEEAVDFDMSVRPAPLMTEEVTMRLEDVIIQRIKDKAWDDVERKVKPVDTPSEFKKKLALDQEKSKLSLAEVYEQEFIKQREAATADDTEKQETEPALHVEVRSMLHTLFNKLDALSNYHYTPRPVAPELKVVTNVAAITMEEVAPTTVTDSALLAPQEIRGKKHKGELLSKEERTDTDKKRARRLKKTRQRQRQRDRAKASKQPANNNLGFGNKYSKLKAEKQVLDLTNNNVTKMEERKEKVVRTSTTFFSKLQDEVKSQIKSKTSPFAKKKDKRNITAKKLKL